MAASAHLVAVAVAYLGAVSSLMREAGRCLTVGRADASKRWRDGLVCAPALGVSTANLGTATAHAQDRAQRNSKGATVLFMCPHGAAKSVLASAYFQRVAKERCFERTCDVGGHDLDAQVSGVVASYLKKNGYEVPVAKPRRVTTEDMVLADVVISIGCDVKDLPTPRASAMGRCPFVK